MVITIVPHARDKFHDLATLSITHKHGVAETPARIVNRYDLNAKSNVGADVPLMRDSNVFMLQESIDPKKLESIMSENGFLNKVLVSGSQVFNRVDEHNLKLFHPSFTQQSQSKLVSFSPSQKHDLICFLCNVAKDLALESLVLPAIYDIDKMSADVSKFGLQLIPSLNMKSKTAEFENQIQRCVGVGCHNIPIIALEFARYAKANLAYDYIMQNFDKLHEGHQAIMMVNATRAIYSESYKSVSALHYGAFFAADLSVERYGGGGGTPNRTVRLFSSNNLTAPKVGDNTTFDVDAEKTIFDNDPKLQDLFNRVATDTADDNDWKGGRPKSLSRVHENVKSHPEFRNLSKSIEGNSARDYLKEKSDMNVVLTRELKLD